MEKKSGREKSFIIDVLPWVIGLVALILCLVTLNHWISGLNLQQVSRVSGWTWQPEIYGPAYYVATFPLRWLPAKWVPLGLNLFSAACAALALAQLARSAALLPHDRTHGQRLREHSEFSLLSVPAAWLPIILAVSVCGLQLTFWEQATNGGSEMFDLLLFSYVVRCLFEYRIDWRESRLLRAAFVFGIAITNNWLMAGFFPLFIVALVWIRGVRFFNVRFLGGMAACGIAGLLLYLLLPLLAQASDIQPIKFWPTLKTNLEILKIPVIFYKRMGGMTTLLLCLTSLLPAFVLSIRWASYFGDSSRLGTDMATAMFHFVHGILLIACLWVTFDPPFSPRNIGHGVPFLHLYYLAALSVGYCSGYFLLVFRNKPGRGPVSAWLQRLHSVTTVFLFVLLIVVPVGLVLKNLPQIRETNGPLFRQYAEFQGETFPKTGVLVSDDPRRLMIAQAWLARTGRDKDILPLDTQSLPLPGYHRYLHKKYPQKWETVVQKDDEEKISPLALIQRVAKLAETSEVYYLHPSFGYYFEFFYLEPHGLAYKLKRYNSGTLLPPRLTPEIVAENEALWAKAADGMLKPVLDVIEPPSSAEKKKLLPQIFKAARLPVEPNALARKIGSYYSRALDYWGVEMQKIDELKKAENHFELAEKLNPNNMVASINLAFNRNLQAGHATPVELTKSIEDAFGKFRRWDELMNENGPCDELNLCFAQGYVYLQGGLFRQAAQPFDRVRTFAPDDLTSRLWLAQLNMTFKAPEKVLEIAKEIRSQPERFPLNSTNNIDLLSLESNAHFALKEPEAATRILEAAMEKDPENQRILRTATSLYLNNGLYTNGLEALDRQLKLTPDDASVLLSKSYAYSQMKSFDRSLQLLDQVLTLQPTNTTALLSRANINFRADRLDAAKADYERLEKDFPGTYQIHTHFGLAEIAWKQHDTNTAIRRYESYFTNSVAAFQESITASNHLHELKGSKTN